MNPDLTQEEKRAIAALKRVAKKWPRSLWLFSASGTLCVMKKRDGKSVYTHMGSVDQDFAVDEVKIENDGGDW